MNIDSKGTIIIHSSMKSIGEVEGQADTVLDAFSEFMKDGLLVFPTHTWAHINEEQPKFYVEETPTNIGILTELFRKRPDVVRSLHPTHSVAALGDGAEEFVAGDEQFNTPIARGSSWGKLLDREAKILLVGVDLTRNTFIHGIEEWVDIPNRLTDHHEALVTVLPDGTEIQVPSRRHVSHYSLYYWKVEKLLAEKGAIEYAQFGDAKVLVCDTVKLTKYISMMLEMDPDLFSDNEPLTEEFIEEFRALT
ncbi:aminoglycoside 3-N-acetyltransferase [Atopostipes suicloacalis DSM 15692]|uniref:Aminoglycoside N(3)-acetyltransferase n=1 Tax=Atopostipes suicloacalis DSM 15692 TaxID=1121025 RepID=A0A1M4V337_9LACT|nr:AAC(3) family N-acetyltransferase [Atopostipes suicloacalis]SHE63312.1 aminoglycoside 3-N-acetyltransferase [Atopostipes suicloacalis DSM 15692]